MNVVLSHGAKIFGWAGRAETRNRAQRLSRRPTKTPGNSSRDRTTRMIGMGRRGAFGGSLTEAASEQKGANTRQHQGRPLKNIMRRERENVRREQEESGRRREGVQDEKKGSNCPRGGKRAEPFLPRKGGADWAPRPRDCGIGPTPRMSVVPAVRLFRSEPHVHSRMGPSLGNFPAWQLGNANVSGRDS